MSGTISSIQYTLRRIKFKMTHVLPLQSIFNYIILQIIWLHNDLLEGKLNEKFVPL